MNIWVMRRVWWGVVVRRNVHSRGHPLWRAYATDTRSIRSALDEKNLVVAVTRLVHQ